MPTLLSLTLTLLLLDTIIMRFHLVLALAAFAVACNSAAPVTQNTTNSAPSPANERPQSVTAHTTENNPPAHSNGSSPGKWSASGDPIDTAKFDGTIAEAEKAVKSKPNEEAAKKTLAEAYFDRGFALTEARQYASALGDYRRALKYDPNHEESKKWIDIIIGISVNSVKKDPPAEGEEPPPLPFKKS
jgi:tetratricopeptide (TPR) repeat protein